MTYYDLLLSQVSALYSLNIWVSAFFFFFHIVLLIIQSKAKKKMKMNSRLHGKYHNINWNLEANGLVGTNGAGQLCLIPDKTVQSQNNTKIIIKQSMSLVRHNNSDKIYIHQSIWNLPKHFYLWHNLWPCNKYKLCF